MKYMGNISLRKTYPMSIIASELRLKEIAIFDTQDIVGNVMVLLHLSFGDMANVQKLKMWVHHIGEAEGSEFWKLVIERLKDIIKIEESIK